MNAYITHVVIHGRVQGVGYRVFVEHEAGRLGLRGYVRNRHDSSVEALFVGSVEAVRIMVDLCREGPPGARVDRIEQREASADDIALANKHHAFAVLPTI